MTAPRQVLPGTTYLVTRRCAQRQFLLKPSRTGNEVFLYILALAAQRYGIKVHAFCVLSNHYHLVLSDPAAQLPAFQQFLNGLVARAFNAFLRHEESFWGPSSFSAVALMAPRDVVDKTAYTLANPVAAGLVRPARQWPGLWSSLDVDGADELRVPRPKHFFDPQGTLPESVTLRLTTPPGFPTAEAFREQVEVALKEREAAAVRRAPRVLGPARVLAQKPSTRPRSKDLLRQLSPRVAARDKWKRIEALGNLLSFLDSYRRALGAWREGKYGVLFPAGTYLMRVMHGVACAGAG
jgi:REP element-mobilizing transposase RayT